MLGPDMQILISYPALATVNGALFSKSGRRTDHEVKHGFEIDVDKETVFGNLLHYRRVLQSKQDTSHIGSLFLG